jgi:hypothetical protein
LWWKSIEGFFCFWNAFKFLIIESCGKGSAGYGYSDRLTFCSAERQKDGLLVKHAASKPAKPRGVLVAG